MNIPWASARGVPDAAVNQAEESAKKLEARYLSEKNEEMYGRAVSMLKAGTLLTR